MIRPRADWGAAPPRGTTSLPTAVGVAVHWEGPHMGAYSEAQVPSLIRGIQRYHMATNGWADVAYNFVVDRYGGLWEGRGWNRRSAANGTNVANSRYLAVCYLGGEGDPFTGEAKAAIQWLIAEHVARGGRPDVTCHRDHTATACPGDEITAWVRTGTPLNPTFQPAAEEDDLTPEQAQQLAELHHWLNPTLAGGADTYIPALLHRLMIDAVTRAKPADTDALVAKIEAAAAGGGGGELDYDRLAGMVADEIMRRVLKGS